MQGLPAGTTSEMQPRGRWALALALLVGLAWAPAVGGDFVWDDINNLVNTDRLMYPDAFVQVFRHDAMWSAGKEQGPVATYRPLALASFVLDFQLYGRAAWGFHLSSVLLHLLVTLLFFAFLTRWVRDVRVAFGLALVWALHPTAAEAVAWINGRSEVLALLFGLCAALAVSRPRLRPIHYLAAWAGLTLALLGKETGGILVPVAVWLAGEADGRAAQGPPWRRVHWPMVGVGVLAILSYGFLRHQAITGGVAAGTGNAVQAIPALPAVWARALQAFLLPVERSVGHLHHWLVALPTAEAVAYGAAAALMFAVIGAAWWKGERVGAVALLWWLGSLMPVSLVVVKNWPGLYRWLYIGSPGLVLAAWRLALYRAPTRRVLGGLAVASVLCLVQVERTIAVWRTDGTLWMAMVEEQPDEAYGYIGLGRYLLQQGDRQLAHTVLQKAIDLGPGRPEPYFLQAALYTEIGRCHDAWKVVAGHVKLEAIPPDLLGRVARCWDLVGNREAALYHYGLCAATFPPCAVRLAAIQQGDPVGAP